MKLILKLINPLVWFQSYKFQKSQKKTSKAENDLELNLYSQILRNDMLHYGYFQNPEIKPESISIELLENAQIEYANLIIKQIENNKDPLIDVGCGMGGLANLLFQNNFNVELLTPDKNQYDYIIAKYPNVRIHNCKFEELESNLKYGTIINSESLQYIDLETAFKKAEQIAMPNARWIIIDYFRKDLSGISKSGHYIEDFENKCKQYNWIISYRQDITDNILPTLFFINVFVERIFIPVKVYLINKLLRKKPWLYDILKDYLDKVNNKINKEKASIDPKKFKEEKQYMLYVLEKTNS